MKKTTWIFAVAIIFLATANMAFAQNVYWSGTQGNQIWHAPADGSGTPTVLYDPAASFSAGPTGIDLNPLTGDLFWGTGNNTDFWSGNADGSGAGFFVDATANFDEAHGTAVDPANNRVFLIHDSIGLWSVNTNGTGLTDLGFSTGGNNGLEWDAANNRVLVTSQFSGEIYEVAPDGSSSNSLVSGIGGVRDVATSGDSIFWVDNTGVFSSDANGNNVQLLSASLDGGNVRTVDYFNGTLYLGEFGGANNDTIWTLDLGSGATNILYQGALGSIRGITVGAVVPEPGSLAVITLFGFVVACRRRRA